MLLGSHFCTSMMKQNGCGSRCPRSKRGSIIKRRRSVGRKLPVKPSKSEFEIIVTFLDCDFCFDIYKGWPPNEVIPALDSSKSLMLFVSFHRKLSSTRQYRRAKVINLRPRSSFSSHKHTRRSLAKRAVSRISLYHHKASSLSLSLVH